MYQSYRTLFLPFAQGRIGGPKLEETVRHNLKTLYDVDRIPSDTRMREVLDDVDPREIREAFGAVFHEAQRGKLLERYKFLDGYLCLILGRTYSPQ